MPTFLELRLKRHKAVKDAFIDLDNIHQSMKEVTRQLDYIKSELSASYYAKAVLTKGYGVGDVVIKDGIKMKVSDYTNGMFWGSEIGNNKKKKLTPLYDGWEIL